MASAAQKGGRLALLLLAALLAGAQVVAAAARLPRAASSATCGSKLKGVDLWGGDLRAINASSYAACCAACAARKKCGGFTYVPSWTISCYLKKKTGWAKRAVAGRQSWVAVQAAQGAPPPPRPPPPPKPECAPLADGVDLWDADLADGTVKASTPDQCCAACAARPGCGAFTFVASWKECYLKAATGWQVKHSSGMKSWAVGGLAGPTATPSPPPPSPPPAILKVCGPVRANTDLHGGNLSPNPWVAVGSLDACCDACKARADCGAYTMEPWLPGHAAGACYLKKSSGWQARYSATTISGTADLKGSAIPFVPAASPPPPGKSTGNYSFVPLSEAQMRRMYQLTSIFENADTTLQYGYAQRLHDDRGITFGFCGFTTGTADGLMVAELYAELKPNNNTLAQYLPALRAVVMQGDVFTGLTGFESAVHMLGADSDFIKAQWEVCDNQYHLPAMDWCRKVHCQYALTKAQLHDALVQHGQGRDDRFSVDYIFDAAQLAVNGTPATGVNETAWLAAFLQARYDLLYRWDSTSRASVRRVVIYEKLLQKGNLELDGPIYLDLVKRQSADNSTIWQVEDVYYGEFIIYDKKPQHRLELII